MNVLRTTVTFIGWSLLAGLAALLVWANWEPKPLHAYAKPVTMSIFQVAGLQTASDAQTLNQQIERLPGVTACSANPTSHLIAVTYYPAQQTEDRLRNQIQQRFQQVSKPSFESSEPAGPQCPVPAEYILKLEQFKYALCFR